MRKGEPASYRQKTQYRNYKPLQERRHAGADVWQRRHRGRIGPAPANADIVPFAENRVADAEGERQRTNSREAARWPSRISDRDESTGKARKRNEQIATGAVEDRECQLAWRFRSPDRIKRQLDRFPGKMTRRRDDEIRSESIEPAARGAARRFVRPCHAYRLRFAR